MARGQIAIEFALMMALAFVFFAVAAFIVGEMVARFATQRSIAALQDETAVIQQELLLATTVEEGYQRRITLPATLDGKPYNITTAETTLTLTFADGTNYNRAIPPIVGGFAPGQNRIRTMDGEILVDQS